MGSRRVVKWADDPGERPRMLQIVRAPFGGRSVWDVLSERCFGVWLHWVERMNRNQPCQESHCNYCEVDGLPAKWVGYLAAVDPRGGAVKLAEVTSEAWIAGRGATIQQQRQTVRGMVLVLHREKPGRSGKVQLQLLEPSELRQFDLPPAPNVREELERIWGSKLPR